MDSRSLLQQHSLHPRKGMGQHFLVNSEILDGIAAAAHIQPHELVVEVGPGMGALTTVMAPQAGRVLAIELDKEIVDKLGQVLAPYPNVSVVQGDILEVNLETELAKLSPPLASAGYKVVANLPYYITTPILRYFFAQKQRPSLIVVTVQEEVARRMTAATPDMNFLAVLVQFYGKPEIVRLVPPSSFYPPPKVGSAVVRITMQPSLPLDDVRTQLFFRLVSAGFSQPRKQLHNPLGQGLGRTRSEVIAALNACGIDEKRRAETLTVPEWLTLLNVLFPQ
jgi:16S rRNA (adenine1518-N6/adenine1519-N6)-dimethyltransferase